MASLSLLVMGRRMCRLAKERVAQDCISDKGGARFGENGRLVVCDPRYSVDGDRTPLASYSDFIER